MCRTRIDSFTCMFMITDLLVFFPVYGIIDVCTPFENTRTTILMLVTSVAVLDGIIFTHSDIMLSIRGNDRNGQGG